MLKFQNHSCKEPFDILIECYLNEQNRIWTMCHFEMTVETFARFHLIIYFRVREFSDGKENKQLKMEWKSMDRKLHFCEVVRNLAMETFTDWQWAWSRLLTIRAVINCMKRAFSRGWKNFLILSKRLAIHEVKLGSRRYNYGTDRKQEF